MSRISINEERLRNLLQAQRFAQRATTDRILRALEIVVQHLVDPEQLTPEEMSAVADIYPDWDVGVAYPVGKVVNYHGTLVRVVQAHTSQADWLPLDTPALYAVFNPPGTVAPWVQPLGGHDAYNLGDQVTHNGQTWESTINANVWEPGVHGWVVV